MPDGTAVTNFSLAVNRYGGKSEDGGYNTFTIWYRIAVWGKQAEACNQYLEKGQHVTVYGSLTPDKETGGPRTYSRNDGTLGASFEVNADKVIFGAKGNSEPRTERSPATDEAPAASADTEDIPF